MIVIKDMKMPSSCYECHFAKNKKTNDYGSFCECGILEDYETINLLEHRKHPNCPLVEQEFCEDAVSRQAIIDEMERRHAKGDSITKGFVKNMPSVTPREPKKGHWIMTSDYLTTAYGSVDYVKCSCCGEDSLEEGDFCPNCGADMSEVEE